LNELLGQPPDDLRRGPSEKEYARHTKKEPIRAPVLIPVDPPKRSKSGAQRTPGKRVIELNQNKEHKREQIGPEKEKAIAS